jgi:uncharacterized protein YndB with AHSA1/START domain
MADKAGQARATHQYNATPDVVFDAFFDEKIAAKFLFATADGEMVKAEVDPRVGGRFNFTDRRPDMGDVEHLGTYLEIDRPRRLVFEFAVPKYDPGKTTVTIEIVPSGSGSELTLTHEGVPEEWVDRSREGWGMILTSLERALA